MKYFICLLFLLTSSLFAQSDFLALEQKIHTDLENILEKIMEPTDFTVQVSIESSKVLERQLVEGEQIIQVQKRGVEIPKLPGFVSPPNQENPKTHKREVYKTVEKDVLKAIVANITVNENISKDLFRNMRKIVSDYIRHSYPKKARIYINKVKMIKPQQAWRPANLTWWNWLLIALSFCLAMGLIYLLITRRPKGPVHYPEVWSQQDQEEENYNPTIPHGKNNEIINGKQEQLPHRPDLPLIGNEAGVPAFPPIPTSDGFSDKRTILLEKFSTHSNIFQSYYERLQQDNRNDLYSALRGPAFDSLLTLLDLEGPEGSENIVAPTEEKLQFLIKDFDEFTHFYQWQRKQFFGFLYQLTNKQLFDLFQNVNALVGAVILKYLKPKQSALLLDHIDSDLRQEIFSQYDRVKVLSSEELNSIEEKIRKMADTLPAISSHDRVQNDLNLWSHILSQSENQDEILIDIEKTRPDLYPGLAKYRFKLDDIPSLPKSLLHKILDDLDNETLSKALSSADDDLIEYVLEELDEKRKLFIESQILASRGLPSTEVSQARKEMTLMFREQMV